jgi:hypothetical protein
MERTRPVFGWPRFLQAELVEWSVDDFETPFDARDLVVQAVDPRFEMRHVFRVTGLFPTQMKQPMPQCV